MHKSTQTILIAHGDAGPLHILAPDSSESTLIEIDAMLAAASRELAARGKLTIENLCDTLAQRNIVVLGHATLHRHYDAYPGSFEDTWQVRCPPDAPHSLRGQLFNASPLAGTEHVACGLYRYETGEIYLPNDRPYRHDESQREEMVRTDMDSAEIFEQVPLGVIDVPRKQFGQLETALSRALNLMHEAGYETRVVNE